MRIPSKVEVGDDGDGGRYAGLVLVAGGEQGQIRCIDELLERAPDQIVELLVAGQGVLVGAAGELDNVAGDALYRVEHVLDVVGVAHFRQLAENTVTSLVVSAADRRDLVIRLQVFDLFQLDDPFINTHLSSGEFFLRMPAASVLQEFRSTRRLLAALPDHLLHVVGEDGEGLLRKRWKTRSGVRSKTFQA